MTFASWGVILVVLVNAIFFHAMPRLSRPDILFAVTVPETVAAGAGRTLVARYRTIVWMGAAAALATILLLPASDSLQGAFSTMAVVAGNMLVALAAWLLAHRQARAYAVPSSDVRVASLVPRDTSLPGGALFALGPFAILLATALLLYAHRDEVITGSGPKNPFGFLALGAVYAAGGLTMAVTMARRSRQIAVDGPAAAAEQRFRRINVVIPVMTAYGIAILLSAVTLQSIPAFGDPLNGRVEMLLLPLMMFNGGVMFWMFRVGQGGQRAVAPEARRDSHGDATPDRAWKVGGLWYFNPRDPAMWVENRVGVGYTLNIGNWRAWLLMIGLMLAPMIAGRFVF